MKRRFYFLLAALAVIIGLTGCESTKQNEVGVSTTETIPSDTGDSSSFEQEAETTETELAQKNTEEVSSDATLLRSLSLVGVENARYSGGFETADGTVVKTDKILRMGRLEDATEEDINKLVNEYQLKYIIDFRSAADAEKDPDPDIDGVTYQLVSIYQDDINDALFANIVVDEDVQKEYELAASGESDNPDHQDSGYVSYLMMGGSKDAYDSNMSIVMRIIASSEHSQAKFKEMIDIMLAQEDGSIVFHCTAGKDRTGAAVALILDLLGVDRQTIIDDYLLTNEYVRDSIEAKEQAAKEAGLPQDYIDSQEVIHGVTQVCIEAFFDEIETTYGSVENYAYEALGLTPQDITKLKSIYTE